MAITERRKKEFIEGMVKDMTKDLNNPSREVVDGMTKYATDLCNRITTLIQSASVLDSAGGDLSYIVQ